MDAGSQQVFGILFRIPFTAMTKKKKERERETSMTIAKTGAAASVGPIVTFRAVMKVIRI